MIKKLVYFVSFLLLLLIMYLKFTQENKDVNLEWIENTEELQKYRDKFDEKGYLTEDDLKEIRRIQRGQMNDLISEPQKKEESKQQ